MAWRHEEKYLLDPAQAAQVIHRTRSVLIPDAHYENGTYVIQSLYFDDYRFSAMEEKVTGLSEHMKFRIRTYNADPSRISLERKVKKGILTQKMSALIDVETCAKIAVGELSNDYDEKTTQLWDQMHRMGLRPACVVRYRRQAFIYPRFNVRVTFDSQVEYLPPDMFYLLEHTTHRGRPAMMPGNVIMEVKYDHLLPHIVRTVTSVTQMQTSFSKYAACMLQSGQILRQ